MSEELLVLDTSCLLAYVRGIPDVGERIADNRDAGETVFVPVLCLAEAYGQAAPEEVLLLDLLRTFDHVTVHTVEEDMAPFLGGFSTIVGRMDLAHVAITASEHRARVMTAERHLLTRLLSKEWPIIEL